MNKKILAIVGMAVVIAAAGGVATLTLSNNNDRAGESSPTSSSSQLVDTDSPTDSSTEAIADTEAATEAPADAPETVSDDPEIGYAQYLTTSENFYISRVVDHTTSEECTIREVFGTVYRYCFLRFTSSDRFELCLNPVSGETRAGSYELYGDLISVEYDDGSGSEFTIIPGDDGGIGYIIVNYGDYDVYFS